MLKKIIKTKWFYFTIIFVFMLFFNSMTNYIQDDYQLLYDSLNGNRINSINSIFSNLKYMYFNWGGRVLAHFFTYLFLMLPKWIFNVVNSVIYILNIYLIYLIAKQNKKDNYLYILLIHMIVFILFPVFGQVFLWLDGSCNYSFTLCIQLLFIYMILNMKNNKLNYIIYPILSLLAGMCNENSSLSLILFLILYILYDKSNLKIKIISLLSLITGYLFLFLAPGNYIRLKTVGGSSIFQNLLSKIIYLTTTFWPIILTTLLITVVFYLKNKKESKVFLIIYFSSLISFYSMIASPQLSIRSFTITVIYIMINIIIIVFNMNNKKTKTLAFSIVILFFIFISFKTTIEYVNYYKFMNYRVSNIKKAKINDKKYIKLKIYKQSNNCRIPNSCDLEDISKNSEEYPNRYMSRYYGIKIYGYK
ncbi:MAG: hypothetical protein IJ097_02735 [Bacilli bacterium]|nr:hypothetical protein [Bacilli bacterium]